MSLRTSRSPRITLATICLVASGLTACGEPPTAPAPGASSPPETAAPAAAADPAAKRDAELTASAKDPALIKAGKENYVGFCQSCHGVQKDVTGDAASNLFDAKWYYGGRPSEIEQTVLKGVLEKGMPGWGEVLAPEDSTAILAYILSFQKP